MKNNTYKIVWAIVIVVLIIIALVIWASNSKTADQSPTATSTDLQATTSTSTADVEVQGAETGLSTGQSAVAYTDALKTYANKRIQFSNSMYAKECQASPSAVTFASGVKFMIDNRMAKTLNLHFINGLTYSLPAYSFEIISLQTPATYKVDCGSTQNVVTIQIQK